jgi:hypothetical protein
MRNLINLKAQNRKRPTAGPQDEDGAAFLILLRCDHGTTDLRFVKKAKAKV